ncbi:MAG: grasp-with-spasm system SPASM domain peptide maturase [Microscillaceae bacterium]|jgi:SPASM domain peptide maturase of grasp-with-spasm system|nr:grasp-with-spasm system SPASM domain peptide maturase [Microscillaceae bacterium]
MADYFRLFANCLSVKGARRSIICDIQRQNFEFIPNGLYDILIENRGKSLSEIKAEYNNEYDEVIDEYFNFLIDKDFAFWCEKDELDLFPDLDLYWDEPAQITNAIIDLNEWSKLDWANIIQQLEGLGCKHLQVRAFAVYQPAFYESIFQLLENKRIISLEIITPYLLDIEEDSWLALAQKYPRLHNLILHSAPEDKFAVEDPSGMGNVLYVSQVIDSSVHCGIISPSYFSINIKTFTEAQQHNSCLNRKISIDVGGEIKNCPSMTKSYGNIQDTTLAQVLENQDFKKVWTIHKNQIEVCKDCEFRYICTDCRAYISEPENQYSKPAKCNYNPYTATWE